MPLNFDYRTLVPDPMQAVQAGLGTYQTLQNIQLGKQQAEQRQQEIDLATQQQQFNQKIAQADMLFKDEQLQEQIRQDTADLNRNEIINTTYELINTPDDRFVQKRDEMINNAYKKGNTKLASKLTELTNLPLEQQRQTVEAIWGSNLDPKLQVDVMEGLRTPAPGKTLPERTMVGKYQATGRQDEIGGTQFWDDVENLSYKMSGKPQLAEEAFIQTEVGLGEEQVKGAMQQARAAQDVVQTIDQLEAKIPTIRTGKLATISGEAGAWLKSIGEATGIPELSTIAEELTNVEDYEQAQTLLNELARTLAARLGGGRMTNRMIELVEGGISGLGNTEEAIMATLDLMKQMASVKGLESQFYIDKRDKERGAYSAPRATKEWDKLMNNFNPIIETDKGKATFVDYKNKQPLAKQDNLPQLINDWKKLQKKPDSEEVQSLAKTYTPTERAPIVDASAVVTDVTEQFGTGYTDAEQEILNY